MLQFNRFTTYFKYITLAMLGVLLIALGSVAFSKTTHAVSGGDWKAGHIIDDQFFYENGSMSVAAIQAFLNSKVTCDTWGTKPSEFGGGTRAQYSASKGYPAPFTCLNTYSQDGKSSAQIIKEAADTYQVSPKTLIVKLQKEQTLVTDEWPWPSQYKSATGYACPDTAACDSQYYGFYNQVMGTARQFKLYANNPQDYRYKPYQSNYIQYNPNQSCGGSNVHIINKATAGLYNYTPYQPNGSALNNLYGTGDNCGAYGNRNFWRLYNDWFGSTYAGGYSWELVDNLYQVFDEANSQRVDPGLLKPGHKYFVKIQAKNTGSVTWSNSGPNPLLLATSKPENHTSPFCTTGWQTCSRPAVLMESSVAPGAIGNFQFFIQAPLSPGEYREYFKPVAEMLSWTNDVPYPFGVRVVAETYRWELVDGVYKVYDESGVTRLDPGFLEPGNKYTVKLQAKNVGTATWAKNGPTPLYFASNYNSGFCTAGWIACNRAAQFQETSVAPGGTATFEFKIQAPYVPGEYREHFKPVAEFLSWANEIPQVFGIRVISGSHSWELVDGVYRIYNEAGDTRLDPGFLEPNKRYMVRMQAKNTGTATWKKSSPTPFVLATTRPENHNSLLCDTTTWIACSRPVALSENIVAPGGIGSFEFYIKTPSTPGTYTDNFKPVAEFLSWTNEIPQGFGVRTH